jgi:hypothetical protein
MMQHAVAGSSLALLMVIFAGCADELGPETMSTEAVSGTIRFRGRPVGPGYVEFAPVGGTVGLVTSARLKPDGTFHARAVPIGVVGIRVAGVRLPETGDPTLDRALFLMTQVSLIHRRIEAAGTDRLNIDLGVEAVQLSGDSPP